MDSFYTRQIQLWGESTQESLAHKSIAIIGCGGLGCSLGLALGASGIGEIHLVDFDTVSLHNIHRQLAFTHADIGLPKAELLASRLKARAHSCTITPFVARFPDYASRGLAVDLILDATDNLPSRAAIDETAKSRGIPWLYASVEAWHGQVCFFEKATFAENFKITERTPEGIAAPIVMLIAALEANLALRYLAGLHVDKEVLHHVQIGENGAEIRKFRLPV